MRIFNQNYNNNEYNTNEYSRITAAVMDNIMDNVNLDYTFESITQLSEIQSFYNGTTVFLTGATGFIGNLILDKLLR